MKRALIEAASARRRRRVITNSLSTYVLAASGPQDTHKLLANACRISSQPDNAATLTHVKALPKPPGFGRHKIPAVHQRPHAAPIRCHIGMCIGASQSAAPKAWLPPALNDVALLIWPSG